VSYSVARRQVIKEAAINGHAALDDGCRNRQCLAFNLGAAISCLLIRRGDTIHPEPDRL
jgi:hypothetical protein